MTGNDIPAPRFLPHLKDVATALGLLTRIPLPAFVFPKHSDRPAAFAAWAYPLVGLVVGSLCVAAALLAKAVGFPDPFAALIALLVGTLVTGALHEDGLADCADGFWGGWTVERRLDIMKDSQIGAYGVLALSVTFLARWLALTYLMALDQWHFMVLGAAMVSRAVMVGVMQALPNARQFGLSHQTGRPPGVATALALALGVLAAILAPFSAYVIGAAAVAAFATAVIAHKKIRGQTGDVLGASQQLCEVSVLFAYVAASAPS